MSDPRACWYREGCAENHPWKPGRFHCWGASFIEFESGPGNMMIGIVVDDETQMAKEVPVDSCVCFAASPPHGY